MTSSQAKLNGMCLPAILESMVRCIFHPHKAEQAHRMVLGTVRMASKKKLTN